MKKPQLADSTVPPVRRTMDTYEAIIKTFVKVRKIKI
jgi:hypothetical protein